MGGRRRLAVTGLAFVAVCVLMGVLVTWVGVPPFDAWLVRQGRGARAGVVGELLAAATWIGFALPLSFLTAVLAAAVGAGVRAWRPVALVLLAPFVAMLAMGALKASFDRQRPDLDPVELLRTYSMPSGHATCSAALATAFVLALPRGAAQRWAALPALAFAVVVGISRVTRGAHFPTDVFAGWCLGVGVACLTAVALGHGGVRALR